MEIKVDTDMRRIMATARRTVAIEMEALQALSDCLEDTPDFYNCVQAIAGTSGRLIVTGIGKSAIVAQKIVATLNSTGTPSVFMHAADAIHGDLGMVQQGDLVLCLSKSGETPEIRVLAPLVKNLGQRLIAMTANRESTLARLADFVLYTPIAQEADPHNLAPTASTTAQMAMGDALATVLLALKGFSPHDFAKFHPGGALGKQLYLRVRDLYPLHACPAVTIQATIQEIISEISGKRLGATAVLDTPGGALVGIITDGDLRRLIEKQSDFAGITALDLVVRHPKTIAPDAMAVDALALMRAHSISQILVLDGAHYLGMVHLHDLIKEGII